MCLCNFLKFICKPHNSLPIFLLQIIFKGVHLVSIMGNMGTFNKNIGQSIFDRDLFLEISYLVLCISGLSVHPFFFSLLMLFLMKDEETLLNVMKSVTKNAKSILLTFLFAIILVYIFAFVGFIFFRDDFIIEADELSDVAVHKYQGRI